MPSRSEAPPTGTVAAKVWAPLQKMPQPEVAVIEVKLELALAVAAIRSSARPPQPVGELPLGIAVCHWLVWSEWENNCAGSSAALLLWYCCLLMVCTRLPTLATTAAAPLLYSCWSSTSLG